MAKKVAIVGGGVSGSCAANYLISLGGIDCVVDVVVFDQGGRGPGGRSSHRRISRTDDRVLPDDEILVPTEANKHYQFDHGCQFFFESDKRFHEKVLEWCTEGVVKEWENACILVSNVLGLTTHQKIDKNDKGMLANIVDRDFFGILGRSCCYVGVGGMHKISRFEANSAVKKGAVLRSGVRVSKIARPEDNELETVTQGIAEGSFISGIGCNGSESTTRRRWELFGTGGVAALHDTAETTAAAATHHSLGRFDAVIVTDASCSFDGWHRASAGISDVKPEFGAYIKSRARIPLFTAMVAFDRRMFCDHDSAVFDLSSASAKHCAEKIENKVDTGLIEDKNGNKNGLWFAARCTSKSGMSGPESPDCWTLVSTPSFAVNEISCTTMQDDVGVTATSSGATKTVFKPQENAYLNEGPALDLVNSFLRHMQEGYQTAENRANISDTNEKTSVIHVNSNDPKEEDTHVTEFVRPGILYLQGQRWGSALPGDFLPPDLNLETSLKYKNVEGVIYQREIPDLRVGNNKEKMEVTAEISPTSTECSEDVRLPDFLLDDELGLYYAGDFCSHRTPGIEAACLSGIDVATHVFNALKKL